MLDYIILYIELALGYSALIVSLTSESNSLFYKYIEDEENNFKLINEYKNKRNSHEVKLYIKHL